MAVIRVEFDVSGLNDRLRDVADRKIPWAMRATLNTLAGEVKSALVDEMRQVFDQPTSYTLNSLYVQNASVQRLEARIGLKTDTYKGTPASRYLGPEISGGQRSRKRVERALSGYVARLAETLSRLGLPGDFVPGAGAQLDAYGNMMRGQYGKILSQLGGQSDSYANETAASRDRREGKAKGRYRVRARPGPRYFVGGLYRARHLAPGVWVRVKAGDKWDVMPVLLATHDDPTYQQRLPYYETADEVMSMRATDVLNAALAKELGPR